MGLNISSVLMLVSSDFLKALLSANRSVMFSATSCLTGAAGH